MSSAYVVGAGVFGASLARELALRDWDVTLVEQHTPGTVRSASGGDTRLLRAAHGDSEWYTASAVRARSLWLELEAATGTRIWEGVGLAWLARRADGFEAASAPVLDRLGIAHEWLAPDDARGLFPSLAVDDLYGVLLEPDAGVLHARRATQLLVSDGEQHGVTLQGARLAPGDDPAARRRRLGLRRLAPTALSRARRGRGLAPRCLLPRRRPFLAGSSRLRRLRRRVLRARRRRRARHQDRTRLGERHDRPRHARPPAVAPLGGGGAQLCGAPIPLTRRRAGPRRPRMPIRPLGGHPFHRRPPSGTRRLVARRRRVRPQLQARACARGVRRRLHRGHAGARDVPRARPARRRRGPAHRQRLTRATRRAGLRRLRSR